MIDHIGLNVPDLAAAKSYYDVMMPFLGYEPFFAADDQFSYRLWFDPHGFLLEIVCHKPETA